GLSPANEFDSELVGRVGCAKIFRFVEPQLMVELEDRWDRALADADGADRFGFYENDAATAAADEAGERRGRHPPCSSAADNDDAPDRRAFAHPVLLRPISRSG